MLRWMGPRGRVSGEHGSDVTDDPLAAIDPKRSDQGIYSVSRSVYLPRVAIRNAEYGDGCGHLGTCGSSLKNGVNPIFIDTYRDTTLGRIPRKTKPFTASRSSRQSTPTGEKSSSSGYGGSHGTNDPAYVEVVKLNEVATIEQNSNYVKSIKVASNNRTKNKSSCSASSGTLSTIPEGRIDFTIPRPIWPNRHQRPEPIKRNPEYDSLVDEAVLLYTSLNYKQESVNTAASEVSIREVLIELMTNINATMEGKGVLSPEEMLKRVNEKIASSLEALKNVTEEEMRLLCVNLSNSKNVNSVVRAFSNTSSSGNSSQSSPEWSSRLRTLSDAEEIYQIPSGSSSSGFSDAKPHFEISALPTFVHEDLASVPNGVRNAMIYGTLCRGGTKADKLLDKEKAPPAVQLKKSLLKAGDDSKPSVWEQYYGVNVAADGKMGELNKDYVPKPTDVPVFPGGRPEADFTLDVPRSELLSKRMKDDKKWRCRCRLLTTFLGLVFFLLSVMAVSLILTRGKRMFGSMV